MMLLEEIFKSKKSQHSDFFNLRIHRGLSWFKRAVELDAEQDFQFIALWICFNSIYAHDAGPMQDKQSFRQFLYLICQKDTDKKIYNILWQKYSQPIRSLLDNQYVYQGFWDYQNEKISLDACREGLEKEKTKVKVALQEQNSADILFVLFNRLYTLRNQLMHGGATYHSSLNRKQLQDGCRILSVLLPAFIFILLENADSLDLGKPFYPAVQMS